MYENAQNEQLHIQLCLVFCELIPLSSSILYLFRAVHRINLVFLILKANTWWSVVSTTFLTVFLLFFRKVNPKVCDFPHFQGQSQAPKSTAVNWHEQYDCPLKGCYGFDVSRQAF
jgi:hypothetical protein